MTQSTSQSESHASQPNAIDVHVGSRVRLRRKALRLSQLNLATTLDLTFQQVQKYESGFNRISASKLYAIARELDVPIGWFFDGFADPAHPVTAANDHAGEGDPDLQADMQRLLEIFCGVRHPAERRRILAVVSTMARE